jgi:hypothetical protein
VGREKERNSGVGRERERKSGVVRERKRKKKREEREKTTIGTSIERKREKERGGERTRERERYTEICESRCTSASVSEPIVSIVSVVSVVSNCSVGKWRWKILNPINMGVGIRGIQTTCGLESVESKQHASDSNQHLGQNRRKRRKRQKRWKRWILKFHFACMCSICFIKTPQNTSTLSCTPNVENHTIHISITWDEQHVGVTRRADVRLPSR